MSCTTNNRCGETGVPVDDTTQCCPSNFCHDGLLNLPERRRINIAGVEQGQRCLSTFRRTARGFVVHDGHGGAIVTSQPIVPIPFLRNVILGPDGKPAINSDGSEQEDLPPGFDNLVVSDECGKLWRLHGQNGKRQALVWDGCKFVMANDLADGDLSDFLSIDNGNDCGYYEAVLIDKGGGTFSLGYKAQRSRLAGEVTMFAGLRQEIPSDWLVCDGASYDPAEWPALFESVGYSWGRSGDNFRVPDMRGMFARGVDESSGNDVSSGARYAKYSGGNSGDHVGSYQNDAFQCHTHPVGAGTPENVTVLTTAPAAGQKEVGVRNTLVAANLSTGAEQAGECDVPRTSKESRPKNAAFFYIIYAGCRVEQ